MSMSQVPFDEAVALIARIAPAVEAIKVEYSRPAAARAAVAKLEAEANDVSMRTGEANKQLRGIEDRLVSLRRELEAETAKFNEIYEKRKAEEGRLSVARAQL